MHPDFIYVHLLFRHRAWPTACSRTLEMHIQGKWRLALSPARWHGKHTNLSGLGMLGTTQLNSIFFADHITFNNGSMKRAHIRQRMTNNHNNNKRKQV